MAVDDFETTPAELDSALSELLGENEKPGHRLNSTSTVSVSTTQYLKPSDENTPRGVKIQLLGHGGVLTYGMWDGRNPFWTHWAPLPRRRD